MRHLLRALRLIAPNRDGDLQQGAQLYNAHSLNRDESSLSLPTPSKFVQPILPA
jgi:hypothetical protein